MRRNASRLLRTVQNKPHATQADHEDALPTPPPSNSSRSIANLQDNIDIYQDPISSDDERFRRPISILQANPPEKLGFKLPFTGSTAKSSVEATFKKPQAKRILGIVPSEQSAASDDLSSDSDDVIFSSQTTPKRRKQNLAHGGNMHALQRRPRQQTYGKDNLRRQQEEERQKTRKQVAARKAARKEQSPKRVFRRPADLPEFGQGHGPAFFIPAMPSGDGGADGYESLSSGLSSPPSSPGVEIFDCTGLSTVPTTECGICGEQVKNSLRADFEIEYERGRFLNYKWQQRYCLYHKQHDARQVWEERGYPNIVWDELDKRLAARKHAKHLRSVIAGEVYSVFREELELSFKGGTKTIMQSLNDDDAEKGAHVGYYGPRGEKVMTEHIIKYFADQLRECAVKDRLTVAAGIAGGVSGFVQAVLVPELALSLVKEDLGPRSKRSAVDIIAESGELGELLHPEIEDRVENNSEDEDAD